LETIGGVYEKARYVLDPHTAVGINASLKLIRSQPYNGIHTISLSTAHPCKFSKAVNDALENKEGYCWDDIIPEEVRSLLVGKEQRVIYVDGVDVEKVKTVIVENVSK
jgi:threonine synthase